MVVPAHQALSLPEGTSFEHGARLGIPGLTAHRTVHVAGAVSGKIVLVQGAAGGVGSFAVGLARLAGAHVVATVRSEYDAAHARRAGANDVLRTDGRSDDDIIEAIRKFAPEGVDHIVEVAFDANIRLDSEVVKVGGSIVAYATSRPEPSIPFWPLLFKKVTVYLLGSDDFAWEAKRSAALDLNKLLDSGWQGINDTRTFPLEHTALAHEYLETRRGAGRAEVLL